MPGALRCVRVCVCMLVRVCALGSLQLEKLWMLCECNAFKMCMVQHLGSQRKTIELKCNSLQGDLKVSGVVMRCFMTKRETSFHGLEILHLETSYLQHSADFPNFLIFLVVS